MPNTYQTGRVGRVYAASESSYGVAASLAATDAVRHLSIAMPSNPRNRVDSPERHIHPSQVYRFTRRQTAGFTIGGIFYPSGVLNTLPDHTDFLTNGMGAVANITLATTFSGTPTTTGGTVASATGLAAGQAVAITCTGGSFAGTYIRFLTSATSGTSLVWAPALPQAPVATNTCKGCITYSLATALPASMDIAHYLTSYSFEETGCVINNLKFTMDANDEMRWEASGPAQERVRNAQTVPGAYTIAGTTPPSGLTGGCRIGASALEFLKAELAIDNAMELDNMAYGTSQAQAMFRKGKRKVTLDLTAMMSSDITLMDIADNTSDTTVLIQTGTTPGSILAIYCPTVEFEVPDNSDSDETNDLSFKGVCKATSAGNDECFIAAA